MATADGDGRLLGRSRLTLYSRPDLHAGRPDPATSRPATAPLSAASARSTSSPDSRPPPGPSASRSSMTSTEKQATDLSYFSCSSSGRPFLSP
ncbi:hypothetical protein ACP70R_013202 [Stipagrostis hirtigluma subsp. patula]